MSTATVVGIWQYRHALRHLVERDLTSRYKRSVLGFLWSLLNPVLLILTFLVAFKYLMGLDEPNYTARLFTTVLAWRFFNSGVLDGASSVAKKIMLVKKVNFPRIILPMAALTANFIDFLFALGVLAVFFIARGVTPNWPFFPLALTALMIQILFTFGLSLLLASVSVFYSDVQFTVASLFQMWFFLTPVVVTVERVLGSGIPEVFKTLYFLNPMAPIMVAYGSILPELQPARVMEGYPYPAFLAWSALVAVTTVLAGLLVFRRLQGSFAKEG